MPPRPSTFLRAVPRFLDLSPLTDEEENAFDDALEAHGITISRSLALRDFTTDLYDLTLGAAPIADIAREALGRAPVTILHIEGLVPFDFDSFKALPAMDKAFPGLPSYLPGPGPYAFFGRDTRRPPYLWASHEAPGLHVMGFLPKEAWALWAEAFDHVTQSWPLRR